MKIKHKPPAHYNPPPMFGLRPLFKRFKIGDEMIKGRSYSYIIMDDIDLDQPLVDMENVTKFWNQVLPGMKL